MKCYFFLHFSRYIVAAQIPPAHNTAAPCLASWYVSVSVFISPISDEPITNTIDSIPDSAVIPESIFTVISAFLCSSAGWRLM